MLDDYATKKHWWNSLSKCEVCNHFPMHKALFLERKIQKIDDPWLIFISHIWLWFKSTNTMETAGSMILVLISNTLAVQYVDGTVLHA